MTNTETQSQEIFRPLIFRGSDQLEMQALTKLRELEKPLVCDEIERQLRELVLCRTPILANKCDQIQAAVNELVGNIEKDMYGVWVYYPWRRILVHLLNEDEFVEVRTNRNQLKITQEEQQALATKKVGIIGLSVGQSIALTMTMERTCGKLFLADFDDLDLSNLNRLRTGIFNIAVPKVIIAAREIAEIDPFIQVEIFPEGLQEKNLTTFLCPDGPLDLLVEVCDSFNIKMVSRIYARENKIPVVMDTNDRGMLDIERFDLEPERPIFHGLTDNLTLDQMEALSPPERLNVLMKVADAQNASERMKLSLPQIKQSLLSWPQLASDVVLGGAITTNICRRILLQQHAKSGRYFIDLDTLID